MSFLLKHRLSINAAKDAIEKIKLQTKIERLEDYPEECISCSESTIGIMTGMLKTMEKLYLDLLKLHEKVYPNHPLTKPDPDSVPIKVNSPLRVIKGGKA